MFDATSKSLYCDAGGLGGADAVMFTTIDALKNGRNHTDFVIV